MSTNTPGGETPPPYDPSGQPQQPSPYQQPGPGQPAPYQQGGMQPAPGGQYGAPYNPYPKNPLGIWSLVLGILGLLGACGYGFGVLPAIGAVITGHLGRKAVREGTADNDGMNMGGLITGYIAIGLSLLVIVLLLAGIGFLASNPEMVQELEQGSYDY